MKSVINNEGVEASGGYDAVLRDSRLSFEIVTDRLIGAVTNTPVPGKKLLLRHDTREVLGIVGEGYNPSDPRDFLTSQYELAKRLGGQVVRAGFIPAHSRAFAFVDRGTISIKSQPRQKGDVLRVYVYSTDGWDGGTPRRSRLYVERLVCLNGMTSQELDTSLWVSHTKGMLVRYVAEWESFLSHVDEAVKNIQGQFARLMGTPMNFQEWQNFLGKLVPGESVRTANRRHEIEGLFIADANNTGSRWDAYNAVTEWSTHRAHYRAMENTSSETNRFLAVMDGSFNRRALNLLLN